MFPRVWFHSTVYPSSFQQLSHCMVRLGAQEICVEQMNEPDDSQSFICQCPLLDCSFLSVWTTLIHLFIPNIKQCLEHIAHYKSSFDLNGMQGLPVIFTVLTTIWLDSSNPNYHLYALFWFSILSVLLASDSAQILNNSNAFVSLPVWLLTHHWTSFNKYFLSTYFMPGNMLGLHLANRVRNHG